MKIHILTLVQHESGLIRPSEVALCGIIPAPGRGTMSPHNSNCPTCQKRIAEQRRA